MMGWKIKTTTQQSVNWDPFIWHPPGKYRPAKTEKLKVTLWKSSSERAKIKTTPILRGDFLGKWTFLELLFIDQARVRSGGPQSRKVGEAVETKKASIMDQLSFAKRPCLSQKKMWWAMPREGNIRSEEAVLMRFIRLQKRKAISTDRENRSFQFLLRGGSCRRSQGILRPRQTRPAHITCRKMGQFQAKSKHSTHISSATRRQNNNKNNNNNTDTYYRHTDTQTQTLTQRHRGTEAQRHRGTEPAAQGRRPHLLPLSDTNRALLRLYVHYWAYLCTNTFVCTQTINKCAHLVWNVYQWN